MERVELEKSIEEAKKELIRLSPIHKKVLAELSELDREITYWARKKYQTELKLVKVQKLPTYTTTFTKRKVKVKRDPTVADLLSQLKSISSFDKERLLDALAP